MQITSWSDRNKVLSPVKNRHLIYWCVERGLYFNPLVRWYIIRKKYGNKPSAVVFDQVFSRLGREDKYKVINQTRLIFNPVCEEIRVQPDLRIHARADSIIKFPDGPAVEVPGDHFSIYTHPREVYEPINSFIKQLQEIAS